jgi:trehalose 6-phosphate synthase/phosphatase
MSRLIIVSNRLPVSLTQEGEAWSITPSVGGLATSLRELRSEMELLWVGWPGVTPAGKSDQKTIRRQLIKDHDCDPIFLPPDDFELFYTGFSNGTLWPLFHYFSQYAHFEPGEWEAYSRINQLYCDKVLEVLQPGDRIWVHDYHLMRLPAMVRAEAQDASIGFFLHIPFPSYEIFRMLPWREELLHGLLGSDLIGFHSFSYARHFLSSMLRILGIEHEFGQAIIDGRTVKIDTFPLGVNIQRFEEALASKDMQRELDRLLKERQGRKVILSVDRLDFTKGILERLLTYEEFLGKHPEWHEKVVLISLTVPSRTGVPEYQDLKRQVDELVGRINGTYGQPDWSPIVYLYRSLPFERLVALYRYADIALVTPLRDGMNLVAKEYLAARPEGTGVLVLSESAGAAEELGEALIVNPHDRAGMVAAIEEALRIPEDVQRSHNQVMQARLQRYDTSAWALDFLSQLQEVHSIRPETQKRRLRGEIMDELLDQYRKAKHRLLLLDYDGTLVHFSGRPEAAVPDQELLEILATLKQDSKNTLVIISGRDHQTLDEWFGELDLNLVAEHGARIRLQGDDEWEMEPGAQDMSWKEHIRPVMEVYRDRTPGASLEDKGTSLVWHYRRAEPDLGSLRSKELTETLEGYIANTSLQVQQGNRVIEVKQSGVGKGHATQRFLGRDPAFQFVLAIGDDVTDEEMFNTMDDRHWTIKVGGHSQTHASYMLSSPDRVRELLASLR